MEYLNVYDINGNLLDKKIARIDKDTLPNDEYFMVVLLFVENERGEFLLQKTSKIKNSVIATTGGHVTYGDTPLETVIKECKEELGIDLLESDIKYIYTENDGYCLIGVYYTKKDIDISKIILQEEEVESINWYTKEEIENFINNNELRKSNIKPYRRVLEYIKK